MKVNLRKKTSFVFIAVILLMVILAVVPFLLHQDKLLTDKITVALQKTLAKNNLKVQIGRIHWGGWNRFTCSQVRFIDAIDNTVPLESERIDLIFDPFALVFNRAHLEASIGEVHFIGPKIILSRDRDGQWNFTHFLSQNKRELQLKMMVRIRNGWIQLKDREYGRYSLEKMDGNLNMVHFPMINWDLKGQSDFCSTLRWSSRGVLNFNELSGTGSVMASRLNLKTLGKKAENLLLKPFPCVINGGTGDIQLTFAWNRKQFWLENGRAEVSNAGVYLPQIADAGMRDFQIKNAKVEFNPEKFKFTKVYITHGQTVLQARGEANLKDTALNMTIDAQNIDLSDLAKLNLNIKDIAVNGLANVKLNIGGLISAPVLDGEVSIKDAAAIYQDKETVDRITGKMTIKRNNLVIAHLEGFWRNSLLQVAGNVTNLLKPSLNLTVYGSGLNITQMGVTELLRNPDIEFGGTADMVGQITGDLSNPQLSCMAKLDHLAYQNVRVSNLQAKLTWDQPAALLKILELNGDIWDGHFTSKGEIHVDASGANWRIKGNLSDLNLNKTALGVKGRVSADMVLKGAWEKGKPLNAGDILGTFGAKQLDFGMAYVDAAKGVFSFHKGFLTIDSMQAAVGEGRVFGSLLWDKNGMLANVNAENIKFHDLFPNNKRYPFDGIFKGNFTLEGPLDDISGKVSGVIAGAQWSSKPIGEIRGDLIYRDRMVDISGIRVASDLGDLTVKGQVAWKSDPVLKLNVASERMDLKEVLARFAIKTPFELSGLGWANFNIDGSLSKPNFHGELNLKSPGLANISMEQGVIQFDGNLNEMKINKCEISKGGSSVQLTGLISKDKLSLKIAGHSFKLDNLHLKYGERALTGSVDLAGNLSGLFSAPVFRANVTGTNLSFGEIKDKKLSAQLYWERGELKIVDSNLIQGNDNSLKINGKIMFSNPMALNLNIKVGAFNLAELKTLARIPRNIELKGNVSGSMQVSGTLKNPFVQATGQISDGSFNNMPIKGDFELGYTPQRITLQRMQLVYGAGLLFANGSWENDRSIKAQIHLIDFPLDITRLFLSPSLQLAGKATSNINLQWSNLGIFGDYGVDVSEFNFNNRDMGTLHLRGKLSDLGLEIEESQLTGKSGIANVEGYIPWPDKLAQGLNLPPSASEGPRKLDLKVTLKNMAADLINKYFLQFSVLNGIVNGKLQVGGELQDPEISGFADCNNVKLNVRSLPLPIDDFQASVSIVANTAYLNKARGSYGSGKFAATGDVGFDGFKELSFNLALAGSRLYYQNLYFDGYCDANVKVTGVVDRTFTVKDSMLSGDATIYNCKVGLLGVPLGGAYVPIWDPKFDLSVKTGNDVRGRIIGLADLDVNKCQLKVTGRYTDVVLDGAVDANTGMITFYGQTFRINRAKAYFRNSKGFRPYLEIDSSQMKSQVEIFLSIKGPYDNFSYNLSSEPYLPQSQLYSFLNWSDLRGDEPLSATKMLSGNLGLVTDTILGDFLYELRRTLNIDYLYLEPDFQGNAVKINVGKYLNDQVFLSYSRFVAQYPKQTWALSFSLTPGLSLGWNYSQNDGSFWRLIYHGRF